MQVEISWKIKVLKETITRKKMFWFLSKGVTSNSKTLQIIITEFCLLKVIFLISLFHPCLSTYLIFSPSSCVHKSSDLQLFMLQGRV